jgi:hypothetical protein
MFVRLHITVNDIKILNVAQKCFYIKFISPTTIKLPRSSHKLTLFLTFNQIRSFWTYFHSSPQNQISWKSMWCDPHWCMCKDKQADMTKLIGDFCNCANAPRKRKDTRTCTHNVEHCLVKWRAQWAPFQAQKRVGCMVWWATGSSSVISSTLPLEVSTHCHKFGHWTFERL